MKKKLIGSVMLMLMLCAVYPAAVSAAQSGTCGAALTWELDDSGTLTISGTGTMTGYSYPDAGPWMDGGAEVKNVVIESGVESVGTRAFCECTTLETAVLPSTLKSIGDMAFYYCGDSFTSVTIPASVNSIGQTAFNGNGDLTIRGYSGSYAETFATEKGIAFTSLGDMPEEEITVSTSDELIKAIGSGRKIILKDGVYKLYSMLEIGSFNAGIKGLTIAAENPGKAEILSKDGYDPVIKLMNTEDITLEGLILGHETISYQDGCGSGELSSGYVLQANNSDTVTVSNCDLYGCGTIALVLNGTDNFTAENCVMRDCKEYIASLSGENININDCIISGNAYDPVYAAAEAGVQVYGSGAVFKDCAFLNNCNTVFSNDTDGGGRVITENCVFHDNAWDGETPREYGVCLNGITWQIQDGTLKLGYPIEFDDGTSIESETGEVLPYSTYSRPWRGKSYTDIDTAEGVIYDNSMSGSCGESVRWQLEEGTLTISGTGEMTDFSSGSNYRPEWEEHKDSIERVVIEEGVTSLGSMAFMRYSSIVSAELPGSLRTIGSNAFTACTALGSVSFGSGLESIGVAAFSGTALTSVTLPDSVTEIKTQAFSTDTLESIVLPRSLRVFSDETFRGCTNLKTIELSEENETFAMSGGVMYTKDMKTAVACPAGMDAAVYAVPDGVEKIGRYAFFNSSIGQIVIPDSVTELEDNALGFLRGKRLIVPASVETIGNEAFRFGNYDGRIYVYAGTAADEYCQSKALRFSYIPVIYNVEAEAAGGRTVVNVAASYESEDTAVIAVGLSGGTVSAMGEVRYGEAVLEGEADTVKVFFWESFESMYPLEAARTVTVR